MNQIGNRRAHGMKSAITRVGVGAFAALSVAAPLAGCGGGSGADGNSVSGGGGGGGGSTPVAVIQSFTATGTNGATTSPASGKPVTITGSQNGGKFSFGWTASNSGGITGYSALLYLSSKPGDTGNDAVNIANIGCGVPGNGGSTDCPNTTGNVPCKFDEPNMTMTCPTDQSQPYNQATYNVGQWLSDHGGLPGNYDLVLQLCTINDATFTVSCNTKTIPVSLN